ncbi:hypothetical protein CP533_5025 [Ophiocordyceps camponoti-saundersi (nom. inval.)]|nr:hypothetical protein CP533_5025 [Ophiocordyceps camponoti-saundersi (nom. inval.)]
MPPSQRRRRQEMDDDDPEEEARPRHRQNRNLSDDELDDDESGDGLDSNNGDASQEAEVRLAKKMVRYVLSCEYSRTTIRREGIKERVLGNQGRSFKKVFDLAQKQLRAVWGMELRELPVREKMTLHEKRQAMKSSSQAKTGSGSYILTSTLPDPFRSATILRPSKTPSEEEEATYAAFYTLVLSLVWLNSGELSDQKLRRYLLRLNADQNVADEKTEMTLKRMEKHGYVMKRVERPPVGHDGEHLTTWHLGPRAKEEVGLDGVMGMVRQVYGSEWSPEIETKLHLSLGIKKRQAAAGGGGASERRIDEEEEEDE